MTKSKSITLGLFLALSGCATAHVAATPAGIVDDPASPVARAEGTFKGAHDLTIFTQEWRPRGEAKGSVVLVHGLMDYSSRYDALARALVDKGIAVYALDLPGHAHSEGVRVDVDGWDEYLDDVDALVQQVRAKQPGKPIVLFGHSMGGAIATSYVLFRKPQLAGLVLSGAALRADAGGGAKAFVRMTGVLFPHAGVFSLDIDKFSRDPAVVAACKADPLVFHDAAPARTARALINAIDDIRDHEAELTLPVLALHGAMDEVTPPDGSETLIATAKSTDKTFRKYPSLVHDLVHEPEHDLVIGDIVTWVDAHEK